MHKGDHLSIFLEILPAECREVILALVQVNANCCPCHHGSGKSEAVRLMLAASVPSPPVTTESVLPSSCHINVLLCLGQTLCKFCKFTLELSLMISKLYLSPKVNMGPIFNPPNFVFQVWFIAQQVLRYTARTFLRVFGILYIKKSICLAFSQI